MKARMDHRKNPNPIRSMTTFPVFQSLFMISNGDLQGPGAPSHS